MQALPREADVPQQQKTSFYSNMQQARGPTTLTDRHLQQSDVGMNSDNFVRIPTNGISAPSSISVRMMQQKMRSDDQLY
jgi:hypothetical protein